jgi:hypothetical protein
MKFNDKRNKNAPKNLSDMKDYTFARVVTFDGQRIMNQIAKKVYEQLAN